MKRKILCWVAASLILIVAISVGHGWLFADQGNGAAPGQGTVAADAPHSPAAIEAKRQYDLSVKQAKEEYRKALLIADQKYISGLEAALKIAMSDGPSAIEEAKRLDAARIAAIDVMEEHKQVDGQRTVNLIPLIDVDKDAVSGKWKLDHGTIVSDDSPDARVRILYEPPEEYDFHIEFVRISGHQDVAQIFRYLGCGSVFQMGASDNTNCGFSNIDGKDSTDKNNPTRFQGNAIFQNGRKYSCLIQVRKDSVVASIDGRVISKCSVDPSKFSIKNPWSIGADGLGVGSYESPTVFSVIEVTEISGPGKLSPR